MAVAATKRREIYLPQRRRMTVDEFDRAADAGLYSPGERLELIEGEVIEKVSPQQNPHSISTLLVEEALRTIFPSGYHVRVQMPLALDEHNKPEPDVAVVTGSIRENVERMPSTAVLVVEVADSTLRFDRTTKASLYARAGVPEYWVVDLHGRRLEVHRDPSAGRDGVSPPAYGSVATLSEGEAVRSVASPSASITVRDLLP